MIRPVDEPRAATHPTTVLDRVRPTVVVRRRVHDPGRPGDPAATTAAHGGAASPPNDDENGPPSSVNVARALASLRGDELRRLDQIVGDDDRRERIAADPPVAEVARSAVPAVPVVRLGTTIAVAELARRLSVSIQELVTTLVTRGFFSVTFTSVLPRETAHAAATLYGWQVEETDEVAPVATKATGKPTSKAKKAPVKAKLNAKTKNAKTKSAKAKDANAKTKNAKAKDANAKTKNAKAKDAKTKNAKAKDASAKTKNDVKVRAKAKAKPRRRATAKVAKKRPRARG